VVGLNAQSKYDELADECKPVCANSEVDSVRTRALVTDILWGTAAAAAITAGVLFFVEGPSGGAESDTEPEEGYEEEGEEEEDDDEDDEDDEEWSQRIHIAPVVGGGTYGLGAEIRF
jgi:ribosomal protein L12E/L44/L45/RPP1/RPP2